MSATSFIMDTRSEYEGHLALWVIEVFCIIVFTFEYVVKFATAPRRLEFARQPMNVIDLAAIVPFTSSSPSSPSRAAMAATSPPGFYGCSACSACFGF